MVQRSNDNKRYLINSYSFPCPEPVTHAHMRILPEFMSIYDNASNMNFYSSSFVNERYTLFCTLIYFPLVYILAIMMVLHVNLATYNTQLLNQTPFKRRTPHEDADRY